MKHATAKDLKDFIIVISNKFFKEENRKEINLKRFRPITFFLQIILAIAIHSICSCSGDSASKEYIKPDIKIDNNLRLRTDSFLSTTMPHGSLGLSIYDITAQKEVYSYRKDTLMRPASCMKLLTCVAALRYFGAYKKFWNRLYITGNIEGDTLQGDLILKTQFDTFFTRDTLNDMLDAIKNKGIKHINGKVIVDMVFANAMDHEQHWVIGDLRTRYMGLVLQGFPYMKREMYRALQMKGIDITNDNIVFGRLNPHKSVLVAETHHTIHHIVEKALKYSSNINAEALLYPLGYIIDKNGNYRNNGKVLLKHFLINELHVKPDEVCVIDDGCGLCPEDKLNSSILTKLLIYTAQRPHIYKEVLKDLPLAGVDGTLHNRMYDNETKGKLRGKTGTLTREGGISTLAGYFVGKDNHLIAYVIMNNECPVETGRKWQDLFCKKVFAPQKLMGKLK